MERRNPIDERQQQHADSKQKLEAVVFESPRNKDKSDQKDREYEKLGFVDRQFVAVCVTIKQPAPIGQIQEKDGQPEQSRPSGDGEIGIVIFHGIMILS